MNSDIYVIVEHLRGQVTDMSCVMVGEARALAQATGGKVVAVLLGHNAPGLASTLAASQVLYVDHPALAEFTSDAYQKVLTHLIGEKQPRAVLLGNTSIGADVASVLSARLQLPLISSCRSISTDGKLTCQICGGKIMAECSLADTTTLVTMIPGGCKPDAGRTAQPPEVVPVAAPALDNLRVTLTDYVEPEAGDVDIATVPILVAVGRGIQNKDNLELAQELADALGGAVCASRPVVDQGWLPTSLLVGKSGKSVKSKVYLTLGISGAPEHIEGITDSEMILAVNTDAAAPIFDVATYGTTADLFDLVPVLTEQVRQAKGG
jgi:electron transfer flavoprotein alpha subunit